MSIFSNIVSKILHRPAQDSAPVGAAPAATTASAQASDVASAAPASSGAAQQPVDVEAVLTAMAAKTGQRLDWRKSIVDLLKLLDLDSSLAARKELAKELHYEGDTSDSAAMNVWLHKQVMQKLAANGGKVPPDLLGSGAA